MSGGSQVLPKVYRTGDHQCSYIDNRIAATNFVDPNAELSNTLYHQLAQLGYRRSGRFIYRPNCPDCNACQSLRVVNQQFTPSKRQRRVIKRNSDIQTKAKRFDFDREQFELYRKYITSRHPGGGMDEASEADYMEYFHAPWCDTLTIDFRLENRLVAVSVLDTLSDGYSAVYTYFDPEEAKRSLGSYAILWLIDLAISNNKPFTYLGYWIAECEKMTYKTDYQPCEIYRNGRWSQAELSANSSKSS